MTLCRRELPVPDPLAKSQPRENLPVLSPALIYSGMVSMKLKLDRIAVGKCYATKHHELRQVVSIEPSGEITYDTRKAAEGGGWSPARRFHSTLDTFAREAVSEVPCP
jgi:hypothetical protein